MPDLFYRATLHPGMNAAMTYGRELIGGSALVEDLRLAQPTRAVFVGGAGDLTVMLQDDIDGAKGSQATVTFHAITAGSWLPIRVSILAASSTATNVLGLW